MLKSFTILLTIILFPITIFAAEDYVISNDELSLSGDQEVKYEIVFEQNQDDLNYQTAKLKRNGHYIGAMGNFKHDLTCKEDFKGAFSAFIERSKLNGDSLEVDIHDYPIKSCDNFDSEIIKYAFKPFNQKKIDYESEIRELKARISLLEKNASQIEANLSQCEDSAANERADIASELLRLADQLNAENVNDLYSNGELSNPFYSHDSN